MKHLTATLLLFLTFSLCKAQTLNPFYNDVVSKTSETNVLNDLTRFEKLGIKKVGSWALGAAEKWITDRYKSLGYDDIVLQPFTYAAGKSNNIIVTKTGTVYPNTFIIIDAHYDTINGPGTNDNGTGTVLLMELARLLKDVETEYSIKFIHFSGEEDGLIGSKYYVKNTVVPEQLDIKLVFNIDEVGGVNGMTNDTVVCERDLSGPESNNAASDAATKRLAVLMELYSNLKTEIAKAYASDYMPFEDSGFTITGLFEKNESPVNHSPKDNLAHMDVTYAYEVTKGALGAALEFSHAYKSLSDEERTHYNDGIRLTPDLTEKHLNIEFDIPVHRAISFKLVDQAGKEVYKGRLTKQSQSISLKSLSASKYVAVFKIDKTQVVKSLIVE